MRHGKKVEEPSITMLDRPMTENLEALKPNKIIMGRDEKHCADGILQKHQKSARVKVEQR